ncbi:MAG: HAD-IIA family hydrolase [Oscillibacter sp.]|nr:HAD-IIA family hydrolase [Oscillibacter sp.]
MIDFKTKKLFLLDMDGTLYLGDNLFDGTTEFLQQIKMQGGRYLFATNNSSRSVHAYVDRMARLGIPSEPEDFLTSVDALIWYLRGRYDNTLIYALGTRTFREQLAEAGFHITDHLTDGIGLLVCGFDRELTYQKLTDACYLLTVKDVDYIAANPDWVCPTPWGSIPDCGSICHMLRTATRRWPKFIGKPEPEMAYLSMERCGCTKEETVLVGDRIYTDIACGVNAGIDTAFVLSGEGIPSDIAQYGVTPSGTYRDIREIYELMR